MNVLEVGKIIEQKWVFEKCSECGNETLRNKMVNRKIISGDPEGKYESEDSFWICSNCGFTRKL